MERMMEKLLTEIQVASKSHPDLSLIDLINYVCDAKYPTRDYYHDAFEFNNSKPKWNLTNNDLLQAFQKHNKLRKHDRQTTDS